MLWAVRGTLDNGEDVSIVVEAESQAEAECFGLKRSIPVAVVHPATRDDIMAAKTAKMLWRYTPEEKYLCFGRSLGKLELTFLVVLALGTVLLNLRSSHVALPFGKTLVKHTR